MSSNRLPQHPSLSYTYLTGETIDHLFDSERLQADQYVWICKSKGRQSTHSQRHELFLRARVLEHTNNRVLVRYPKGSTYSVQKSHILPILEHQRHLVLVFPETDRYRRACVVHTLPDENFVEIGCDYGVTTQRIYSTGDSDNHRRVMGIDKSEESIMEARKRFPHLTFYQCDILENGTADRPFPVHPSVVAIDINGNRELEAVLQCLAIVLTWEPRLVVVKSRSLYQQLLLHEQSTA